MIKVTEDTLKRLINEAIEKHIEEEVAAAIEEAKQRVEAKIPQIVAGVTLQVFKAFDIEHMADRLLITVRLEQNT